MNKDAAGKRMIDSYAEEALYAYEKLDDENLTQIDSEFLAYSACSNLAIVLLTDKSTSLLPGWAELMSKAMDFALTLTLDEDLASFLHAEPVPDEYDFDFLFQLMDKRVLLESFLCVASKLTEDTSLRDSIRKIRVRTFSFDDTLTDVYPEVGKVMADYAKTEYSWAVFSKFGFAWWLSADQFIRSGSVSFNEVIESAMIQSARIASDVQKEATNIIRAFFGSKPNLEDSRQPAVLAASTKDNETQSVKFKSTDYDGIFFNALFSQNGLVKIGVLDNTSGDYHLSTLFDGFTVSLSLSNSLKESALIHKAKTEFQLSGVQEEVSEVRLELYNPEGDMLESLIPYFG